MKLMPRPCLSSVLVCCMFACTSPLKARARIVPVRALSGLAEEADLAFLGTVVEFAMTRSCWQTPDSVLGRQACVMRMKVLQPFVMEGKGVLARVPEQVEAIGVIDWPMREFRKGSHHAFCLKWSESLGAFCLPGAMLIGCEEGMAFRVPPDVLEAMLNDENVGQILAPIWTKGRKTSRAERLAAALTYLVRFYRRMLQSREFSNNLALRRKLYRSGGGMVRGHEVFSEIEVLQPYFARGKIEGPMLDYSPNDLRLPFEFLLEAGYVRECMVLQRTLESVAERCSREEDAQALRDLASVFDMCKRWPQEARERRKMRRRATDDEDDW